MVPPGQLCVYVGTSSCLSCNLWGYICAFSCMFPFLISCFLAFFYCLLAGIELFFSLPFWICDFSIFVSIFRRRVVIFIFHPVYFFWIVCGLLGFCGDMYSVPHVSDTYVRGPPFLFFCLRCRCASVIMCTIVCLFYFYRGISSTPELLEPVLRLHCIVAMS